MADDLEKAILIVFDQHGRFDRTWQGQADAFIASVKADPRCWELCCERFSSTQHIEVQFWCVKTLHELVTENWQAMAADGRAMVRRVTWSWLEYSAQNTKVPGFIINKIAQLIAFVASQEYPQLWPSFFRDLLALAATGPAHAEVLCRVMKALDADIISLDIPRSQEDSKRSMEFKDAMREACLNEVAEAWYQLVQQHHAINPDTAASVLETVKLYVNWIDIFLVANERFAPLVLSLIHHGGTERCRAAACEVITEVVLKRMEAPAKVQLIRQLGIVPACAAWGTTQPLPIQDSESDMVRRVGHLLASLGSELLDAWKRVENSVTGLLAVGLDIDLDAAREAKKEAQGAVVLLGEVLPALLQAVRYPDDELIAPVVTFLQQYVARLKRIQGQQPGLADEQKGHVRAIIEAVAFRVQIPEEALLDDTMVSGDETVLNDSDSIADLRRELFTLFRNAARVDWSAAVAFTGSLVDQVLGAQPGACTAGQAEVAITLLYNLGEGAPEAALKHTGELGALAAKLVRGPIPHLSCGTVALAALECAVRYARVLPSDPALISAALDLFLLRGLASPSEIVSTRACYLFMRIAKALRGPLRPHLADILPRLHSHMDVTLRTPPASDSAAPSPHGRAPAVPGVGGGASGGLPSATDNRLYVFEAVGYLLGQDAIPQGDQEVLVTAIVDRISRQVDESLQPDTSGQLTSPGAVGQALQAAGYFSKGFPPNLATNMRPAVGDQILRLLESALHVPQSARSWKDLVRRAAAFAHRTVETLGERALPGALRMACVLLGPGADATDIREAISLANQLVMRFKGAVSKLMAELLPLVAARVAEFLPSGFDWSGADTTAPASSVSGSQMSQAALSEEQREWGDIQKAFYSALNCLATQDLGGVLLELSQDIRDQLMRSLEMGASFHVDPAIRRTCLQTLAALATAWCLEDGSEALPGLRLWALENVAGQCCIGSLLGGAALDVRDAGVWQLTSEVAVSLRSLRKALGVALSEALRGTLLPAVGVRGEEAERVVAATEGEDTRALRTALRGLMMARQGEGGSGRAGGGG